MACELSSTCPFFNDKTGLRPEIAALFKARYCRGDNGDCSRYVVFVARGRDAVPVELSPHDRLRALRILRDSRPGPAVPGGPSGAGLGGASPADHRGRTAGFHGLGSHDDLFDIFLIRHLVHRVEEYRLTD